MNEKRSKLIDYWTDVITDFISSDLSQKEYVMKKSHKVYSLGYWYRKFYTDLVVLLKRLILQIKIMIY